MFILPKEQYLKPLNSLNLVFILLKRSMQNLKNPNCHIHSYFLSLLNKIKLYCCLWKCANTLQNTKVCNKVIHIGKMGDCVL